MNQFVMLPVCAVKRRRTFSAEDAFACADIRNLIEGRGE